MRKRKMLLLILVLISMVGCSTTVSQPTNQDPAAAPAPAPAPAKAGSAAAVNLKITEAYPNLSFNKPLEYVHAGDNSDRVFVVEKTGKILVFKNDPSVQSAQVFLDLTNLVDSRASEKGLLGLAFHPDYKNNGFFYVNYTDQNNTVIARFKVDPADPNKGSKASKTVLMTFPQPYPNHNGGHLAFGPDGYLYIAVGDGGSEGDPHKNGQNLKNVYGKILRIDVNTVAKGKSYGIPPDNPFAGNKNSFIEEIYAYGLRNPWKFSFDQQRGLLWAADVGQDKVEEIDIIKKGANYGWNIMEGSLCYPSSQSCNEAGLTLPVWEYQHPIGESITGGYAYYGSRTPSLKGSYVYGDFVSGMIWALQLGTDMTADNRTLLDTTFNISSFGLDQENELYIVDYNGKIYKLTEQ